MSDPLSPVRRVLNGLRRLRRAESPVLDRARRARVEGRAEEAVRLLEAASPSDAEAEFELGKSFQDLADEQAATDAFAAAHERVPTEPRYLRSLAVAAHRCGRLEQALEAYERLAALGEPPVRDVHARAVVLRKLGRAEDALPFHREAVRHDPDNPVFRHGLAVALMASEDPDEARDHLERAVELDPARAGWWYQLSLLRERHGGRGPVMTSVGIIEGDVGDRASAMAAARRASELAPQDARYLERLAALEQAEGNTLAAVRLGARAVTLRPDETVWAYRLGRWLKALGGNAPEGLEGPVTSAKEAWEHVLRLDPQHVGARQHLTRYHLYRTQWAEATHATYDASSPGRQDDRGAAGAVRRYAESGEALDELAGLLADPERAAGLDLPQELWFVVHARLLAEQWVTLAYRAKAVLAHRVATLAKAGDAPFEKLIEAGKAEAFLGRYQEARTVLQRAEAATATVRRRFMARKHLADIELLSGDPRLHRELASAYQGANSLTTEQAFRGMIEGRRVAVVGPADNDLAQGETIDGFDTVIRTKYVPNRLASHRELAGARTDISYYAAISSETLGEEIETALRAGDLQMVVFRTSQFGRGPGHIVAPGDLRFVPSEFRGIFRAGPFGIQRIVYDLLRYAPSELRLFNMNFFAAKREYAEGYNPEIESILRTLGLDEDSFRMFEHDFLTDFVFIKNLADEGVLTGDPEVTELLRLSPEQYLDRLDQKRAPGPEQP